ncbi:MAG: alpha-hydroxy-acid oxidizing protein, partial [Actinomycetota bacterium]|nr:alpha-hydroxy-acid oxidizing protein [Actinomycetota bacterium]
MDDLSAAARERLDAGAYAFFAGGTGDAGGTAWDRLALRPRVLRDVAEVTTSTTVL